MVNRPAAPTAKQSAAESEVLKQKKANETQQAVVLFIIVLASEVLFRYYVRLGGHSFFLSFFLSLLRHRIHHLPIFTRK